MQNWPKFVPVRGNSLTASSAKSTKTEIRLRSRDQRERSRFVACPRIALLFLASCPCFAEPPTTTPPPIDDAFTRMYNTDFAGAHTDLERYVAAQPADPFGYAVEEKAAAWTQKLHENSLSDSPEKP